MKVLDFLLRTDPRAIEVRGLREFWDVVKKDLAEWEAPIDRSIVGGFLGDRLAGSFAAGYQGALTSLLPELPVQGVACLCATEEGGVHPKAIKTRLEPDGDGFILTGQKKWSTSAPVTDTLLVVASRGEGDDGKNRLALVRLASDAENLHIAEMPATPFVPEIPHGELRLDGVRVREGQVLPGDGYADYLKPFRTIEDLHVQAAVVGYMVSVGRRFDWPERMLEELVSALVSLRALALEDAKSATVHVATAGALDAVNRALESTTELWETVDVAEKARWERDSALRQVAGKARAARRKRAWDILGAASF